MFDSDFIGNTVIKLQLIDSTNNYAANLVKSVKVEPGTVILAHEQTDGKGQKGNKWFSEPGKNLTFSLVIFPEFIFATDSFIISKTVALSLCDCLEYFGISAQIKWPNDILADNNKIAGVLIENNIQSGKISSSIIGVGLNVNQVFDDNLKATSFYMQNNMIFELEKVLNVFCSCFQKWYNLLVLNKHELIHNSYLIRLKNFGTPANYIYKGNTIQAIILNVENSGKLVLRDTKEQLITADIKEIIQLI